jgi:hypothetical protein
MSFDRSVMASTRADALSGAVYQYDGPEAFPLSIPIYSPPVGRYFIEAPFQINITSERPYQEVCVCPARMRRGCVDVALLAASPFFCTQDAVHCVLRSPLTPISASLLRWRWSAAENLLRSGQRSLASDATVSQPSERIHLHAY